MKDIYQRSCPYSAALQQATKGKLPSKTRHLVVTRYREDLAWLNLVEATRVTVYNKGEYFFGYVPLPNIGRDAHTPFYHLANNYNNLSDITYFCQGNPFDRVFGLLEALKYLQCVDFIALGTDVLEQAEPGVELRGLWEELFGEPCPSGWTFRACITFGVSRKRVHRRSQAFYEKCERLFHDGGSGISAESMPYVFEQLVGRIFLD